MLKLSNLIFSYGENRVLNGLNYHFKEGQIYALMGANGSGKSTLFNLLSGFLKPQSGKMVFKDKELNLNSPHQISNLGISRTFQDLRLIPSLSVFENVYIAIKNKKSEKIMHSFLPKRFLKDEEAELKLKVEEILEATHLTHVRENLAENISYGQQKLLNLAQSIANEFELLLLDEPVAGVQPKFREEIIEIVKGLNKTVIFIEHNPDFIQALTENILFLHSGKIIAEGSYEVIKNNGDVQEAYL